ncbi:MAG: DUF4112 domain-containing protein [Microcoleaceae cyanobacterium]
MPSPRSISSITPAARAATVKQLRQLSNLLDNLIRVPGTSHGVGIDPIIGLIPGGGDMIGGALSTYIVFKAFQLDVPKETLVRMASNIVTETLVGTVPVFGDMFDVAWKANVRNVEMLEAHVDSPQAGQKADRGFIFLLVSGLVLLILLVAVLSVAVFAVVVRIVGTLIPG